MQTYHQMNETLVEAEKAT